MITRQKLKIFDKYGGDIDGLERMGSSLEKELFRNDDWSLIDNSYQDIELINKNRPAMPIVLQHKFLM